MTRAGFSAAGKSILEQIWDELDKIMDLLMPAMRKDADAFDAVVYRNQAFGLAKAIAIIQNPYRPDIDQVRSEAMERWMGRNGKGRKVRKSIK